MSKLEISYHGIFSEISLASWRLANLPGYTYHSPISGKLRYLSQGSAVLIPLRSWGCQRWEKVIVNFGPNSNFALFGPNSNSANEKIKRKKYRPNLAKSEIWNLTGEYDGKVKMLWVGPVASRNGKDLPFGKNLADYVD